MRVRGPISGFPAGYKSAAQKQLGKFESLGRDLGFRCVKRRLPDGTRIKTITMKNFATGREMTISGSNSAFQPFRVVRVRPPEEDAFPAVEEELELKMDSGWLAFSAAWLAANLDHFPLGVYVGDEILTYFGQGTTVPGGTPSIQYLIPTAEWSDPAFLPPRLDWPGSAPPTVVAAGSHTYDSPIITDLSKLPNWQMFDPGHGGPVNLTAGRYTGLLRLAVQAKIGAGRDPRPLLWELTVANTFSASSGLIHDNEYNFWKIAIESNGALARKMKHQFETDWIIVQLRLGMLGQYGDDAYTKYMSWLLMGLTVDESVPTVSMLDSDDLLLVYDGRTPLKHGWHYNRTEPFEGSIVTTKEETAGADWWLECTLAQGNIGFEVAGLEPSIQLIIEKQDEQAGVKPLQPLWIEDRYGEGGVDPVVPPLGKSVPNYGTETPVYCFYNDENPSVRQDLTLTAESTDSRDLIRELCYACGFIGEGFNNRWGAGDFTVGGWSIGEFSYADPEFGAAVSQTVGNILISQEGQKTGEFVNDYEFDCSRRTPAQRRCGPLPTDPDVHPGETCIGPAQSWPYPDVPEGVQECGGDVLFEFGNAVYERTDESEQVLSFRNFAIIPAGDAEAVLIGKAKRRNYWKRNREWALECCPAHPLAFTPLTHYWDGENIGPLSTWHNPLFPGCPDQGGVCGGSGPSNPDVDECIVGSRYPNGNCAPVQHDETIVHTVRSSGDAIDANQSYASDVNTFYTDWLPAYAADLTTPHEGWSVPTHGSFSGDGIVYAEIPTSGLVDGRKIEGGFPAFDNEDLHADTFFWTGWT